MPAAKNEITIKLPFMVSSACQFRQKQCCGRAPDGCQRGENDSGEAEAVKLGHYRPVGADRDAKQKEQRPDDAADCRTRRQFDLPVSQQVAGQDACEQYDYRGHCSLIWLQR